MCRLLGGPLCFGARLSLFWRVTSPPHSTPTQPNYPLSENSSSNSSSASSACCTAATFDDCAAFGGRPLRGTFGSRGPSLLAVVQQAYYQRYLTYCTEQQESSRLTGKGSDKRAVKNDEIS
ncbi:hypothetical protein BDZ89DRAFT_1067734 [Hymenopellis radicata]|nr:hypothetical protein BDZ89DRAFT_1067734 [Hymenopellis radicata]